MGIGNKAVGENLVVSVASIWVLVEKRLKGLFPVEAMIAFNWRHGLNLIRNGGEGLLAVLDHFPKIMALEF